MSNRQPFSYTANLANRRPICLPSNRLYHSCISAQSLTIMLTINAYVIVLCPNFSRAFDISYDTHNFRRSWPRSTCETMYSR